MIRGLNKMNIFITDSDREWFLHRLATVLTPGPDAKGRINDPGCQLMAYCLMSNHVHLLVREQRDGALPTFVKRLTMTYVWRFNKLYDREGGLFQGRFQSEPVEDYNYLLGVVEYIHNNPVKAGLVSAQADYRWSSRREYDGDASAPALCELDPRLIGMSADEFHRRVAELSQDGEPAATVCCRFGKRLTDEQATRVLNIAMGTTGKSGDRINRLEVAERDRVLAAAHEAGVNVRQLARLTGLGYSVVRRVVAKHSGKGAAASANGGKPQKQSHGKPRQTTFAPSKTASPPATLPRPAPKR